MQKLNQNNYQYEKYITTPDNLANTINQYGVAIIPNVLNEAECEAMKEGMWDYLETITANLSIPMKKSNPNSWKSFKQLYPKHSMLVQNWSIGHAQFIWDLRTKNKVIEPFEKLWKVPKEDLLVSFDGTNKTYNFV
jgi:hypothetical protein